MPPSPIEVFSGPIYTELTRARVLHLEAMGLLCAGERVFEAGAGIGGITHWLVEHGCRVCTSDARWKNVEILCQRFRSSDIRVCNVERRHEIPLGPYDAVVAYDLLSHLAAPALALKNLTRASKRLLIIETWCHPGVGMHEWVAMEDASMPDASTCGVGTRMSRARVMAMIREAGFHHVYMVRYQPAHAQFPIRWAALNPVTCGPARAVFVGSSRDLSWHPWLVPGVIDEHELRGDE